MDKGLFSQVVHNSTTSTEFINWVNGDSGKYEIYNSDNRGWEMLLTDTILTTGDFQEITKSLIIFGGSGIKNAEALYTPDFNLNCGLNYD